jgi:hypothetical protein
MSPEEIETDGVSFRSLQISWNHLSFAQVGYFDLEDVAQLFQHASQMTSCYLFVPCRGPRNFSMPPIIHQRLKTLRLSVPDWDVAVTLLGSLTLPSLQEFHTDQLVLLYPVYLPALVLRSSCPLARITLSRYFAQNLGSSYDLQPLSGVTDLVLETSDEDDYVEIKKFCLGNISQTCDILRFDYDPSFGYGTRAS